MNNLEFNFLNVGHGDCIVVKFPEGHISMIDVNNAQELDEKSFKEYYAETGKHYDIKLTNPIEWLTEEGIYSIFRFTCTHPDLDHITGLKDLSNSFEIVNFWDVKNNFEDIKDFSEFSESQKKDWAEYMYLRDSRENPKCINPIRDDEGEFWTNDGVEILSPNQNLIDHSHNSREANHMSYVVRIRYGVNVVYLCGDATNEKTFPDLIDHYGEDFFRKKEGENIILKAAHHGRSSGYNKDFVNLISPDTVIVSVGKKPKADASNRYRQHSDNVWSTRWKGNIKISCNPNNYYYSFEHDR
jgi:beta-lactamase superfamily II metal-dependent hydrolase